MRLIFEFLRPKTTSQFRREIFNQVILAPHVRTLITKIRFQKFETLARARNIPVFRSVPSAISSTLNNLDHNSDLRRMFYPGVSLRPDLITSPLRSLNLVRQNGPYLRVLAVGARTEAEILSLVACGFSADNIEAIDLFSYTPLISLGDVTQIGYDDDHFDVVILGWVLEFVTDIEKAVSECIRVSRNGGLICIGAMAHPVSTDLNSYNRRKDHSDRKWMPRNCRDIENWFVPHLVDTIFKSDIDLEDSDKRNDLIVIMKVAK